MLKLFDMMCINCDNIEDKLIDESKVYFCNNCEGKLEKRLSISKKTRPMPADMREVEDMCYGVES